MTTITIPSARLRVFRAHHFEPLIDEVGYFMVETDLIDGSYTVVVSDISEVDLDGEDALTEFGIFSHNFEVVLTAE